MLEFIKQQLALHPAIMPQDVLKMCFQAAYGAEHLLTDIEKVKSYFVSEYEKTEPTNEPIMELIAPEVCRVNIGSWKKANLPPEWLFDLFVQSASTHLPDGDKHFFEFINNWSKFAQDNGQALAFSFENFCDVINNYNEICNGKPQAVHHSSHYKENEKPAYRVISGAYVRLIPVLEAVSARGSTGVIAIDGRAASGKSTLAEGLRSVIGAEIIHMDDFFLPPELRTEERLAQPGGNIHYERFIQEVLPYLSDTTTPFEYRKFNCSIMDYDGVRNIKPSKWRVVEGTYSHHPKFGEYMSIPVFSDIDAATQMERITARNGEKMAEMFATKWIPMEEKYFSSKN